MFSFAVTSHNSLAVYDNANGTANWREQQLYGSSRLGMWRPNVNLAVANGSSVWNSYGLKFFELSNHLGNVMAVISDNRVQNGSVYEPVVVNANDYYAFGSQMPGRSFNLDGSYRYGFNGKENDNEVKGEGNQQDYGTRIYDPRIGKFLSVDPITAKFPELTPYQFASNRPIDGVDQDGLEWAFNAYANGVASRREAAIKKGDYKEAEKIVNSANAASMTAIMALDAIYTKGRLTQLIAGSQFFSAFDHNQAKTGEGRAAQNKESWNNIGQALFMFAGSKALEKAGSLMSQIPVVKNIQAKLVSSDEVNAGFNQKGWQSPYKNDVTLAELNLTDDVSGLVRLSGPDNIKGNWFTTMDEIKGLSPAQLKDKFALKHTPTDMIPVKIKGNVRVGEAAKVEGFGNGGGFQIETLPGSKVTYGESVKLK